MRVTKKKQYYFPYVMLPMRPEYVRRKKQETKKPTPHPFDSSPCHHFFHFLSPCHHLFPLLSTPAIYTRHYPTNERHAPAFHSEVQRDGAHLRVLEPLSQVPVVAVQHLGEERQEEGRVRHHGHAPLAPAAEPL